MAGAFGMTNTELWSLFAVMVAAFVSPLLLNALPRFSIPSLVGEVSLGVALGHSGLGVITHNPATEAIFMLGLAYLLFLAGLETDFSALRPSRGAGIAAATRSPVGIGAIGIGIRLVIAFAITVPLGAFGLLDDPTLVAFLLSSTSLGVVLSVLGERSLLARPFGQAILVSAAIADFATVVLLSVFFSVEHSSTASRIGLVVVLAMAGLAVLIALRRAVRLAPLMQAVGKASRSTTAQIRARGSLALLFGFAALASQLGLEVILGAFIAGSIASGLARDDRESSSYKVQIDAIGFGFLVPAFFVLTGARVDIDALASSSSSLLLVPLLLLAVFAVKIAPAVLYRASFGGRASIAAGVLQSAQMTITVAGVEIGRSLGVLDAAMGSALILVALLTVLIAPVAFAYLYVPPSRPSTV